MHAMSPLIVEGSRVVCLNRKRKLIWRVAWKFVEAEMEFADPKVEESTPLADCFEKHLNPSGSDKAILGHKLRKYQQLGATNLHYFLAAERCPVRNT